VDRTYNTVIMNRILIKFSGEQLSGKFDVGIDPEIVGWLANEVKQVLKTGCELVIVIGGGNMMRGANAADFGIRRVTGDHMGMLSGLMNAMAVTDIFEKHGIPTRCMSNIFADQVAEEYSYRRAEKHLEQGRVLLVAGGLGRPYFTHDTAAVNIALELDCDAVLKGTKVDGVYDKDPNKFPDAVKYTEISFHDAISNKEIQVMDKAALGLAMEQNMPLIVFKLDQAGNMAKVASGESIGTKIS
jgi:uridylate kinase